MSYFGIAPTRQPTPSAGPMDSISLEGATLVPLDTGTEGLNRRRFLRLSTLCVAAGPLIFDHLTAEDLHAAPTAGVRVLRFHNTHTGECRDLSYWSGGKYLTSGLTAANYILRDHRTEDVHPIDPELLDMLHELAVRLKVTPDYDVISGFRSEQTNALLRREGHAVARRSYHLQGKAVDVRLAGVSLARLRKTALGLSRGGVGFYPDSRFVHLDTGPVRSW